MSVAVTLRASRPLRVVDEALLRGGGTVFAPFKFHWWELRLECGHTVERRIRWRQVPNPSRGWAAQHRGVSLDRLPDPPRHARCEDCARLR